MKKPYKNFTSVLIIFIPLWVPLILIGVFWFFQSGYFGTTFVAGADAPFERFVTNSSTVEDPELCSSIRKGLLTYAIGLIDMVPSTKESRIECYKRIAEFKQDSSICELIRLEGIRPGQTPIEDCERRVTEIIDEEL